jgi:hypothetical protein
VATREEDIYSRFLGNFNHSRASPNGILERAKGFEPSTPTLARSCSTPELRPLGVWVPKATRVRRAVSIGVGVRQALRHETKNKDDSGVGIGARNPQIGRRRSDPWQVWQ